MSKDQQQNSFTQHLSDNAKGNQVVNNEGHTGDIINYSDRLPELITEIEKDEESETKELIRLLKEQAAAEIAAKEQIPKEQFEEKKKSVWEQAKEFAPQISESVAKSVLEFAKSYISKSPTMAGITSALDSFFGVKDSSE